MRVIRIGLTPVKGTRHQSVPWVELDDRGAVGDRVFCLVDVRKGRVLRSVGAGSLFRVLTSWLDGVLTARLVDEVVAGEPVRSGRHLELDYWGRRVRVEVIDGPWGAWFTDILGIPVQLARAGVGDVIYGDGVTLVFADDVACLRARRRREPGGFGFLDMTHDSPRFRSTFVIDSGEALRDTRHGNDWTGCDLDIGEARIRITSPVQRCSVVDIHPIDGHRDLRVLAALPVVDNEPAFGMQAVVVRPGLVRQGQLVVRAVGRGPASGATDRGYEIDRSLP